MGVGTPAASLAGLKINPEELARLPESEREFIAEQLAVADRALRENPLLGYQPHGKQVEFHRSPWPRTRLFIGGNRSGKTTATHVDTIIQCLDREVVPEHLRRFKRWEPPFFGRIVGPGLTNWIEGVALQKFREWCPKGQLESGGFARGWDKQRFILRFKNGSWVQFMSNDQDLDKFAGTALHRVVYDESPREDIWSECRVRLRDYVGEELFGLTPMNGMSNFLYDMFYAPWEAMEAEDVPPAEIESALRARLVLVNMDDNPHLPQEDKDWELAGMPPEEREARKTGRFISFSGLIFPEFGSRHIIPDLDPDVGLPPGVEVFEGLDPGLRNAGVPFCYLDEQDRLVVYDELLVKGETIETVCKRVFEKRERWGVQPRWTVIDPAARNKSPQTGRSDQSEYQKHGIYPFAGHNSWEAGVSAVRERLEADPPRLLVCASCRELQTEFKKYRWASPPARSENDPPAKPVKKDDHILDALRYVVMARPLRPEKNPPKPGESTKDRILRAHLKRLHPKRSQLDVGWGPGQFQ